MSYSYAQAKNKNRKPADAESFAGGKAETSLPNSAMAENLGHQVDMPVVMREKMEGAFGMDLSGVKLYENKAVGEAGAEAVTQGSNIAFAPGKLDFSSTHGQALLGHEISHAASQARGEVPGSGLVNDSALEYRADREGLMAARGESVTSDFGGATAPLSSASAASAAGPMQAKSGKMKKYNLNDFVIDKNADMNVEIDRDDAAQLKNANREPEDNRRANTKKKSNGNWFTNWFKKKHPEPEIIEEDLLSGDEMDRSKDLSTEELVDKMFRFTAAQIRGSQEYDTAFNKKNAELIQKHYNDLKNQGKYDNEIDLMDQAEVNAGNEVKQLIRLADYSHLSEEEEEWLDNMFEHPTLDIMQEVTKRKNQMGEQLYKHRQDLGKDRPGEDKGKLDLEAAYSPIATKYNVYDRILGSSWNYNLSGEKVEDTDLKTKEQRLIQDQAKEIAVKGVDPESNEYIKTDEGRELEARLLKNQTDTLGTLSGPNNQEYKRRRLIRDEN